MTLIELRPIAKVCVRCGKLKLFEDFHVDRAKSKDGRKARCRECWNEDKRNTRASRSKTPPAEPRSPGSLKMKACRECGIRKPYAEFRKYPKVKAGEVCASCKTLAETNGGICAYPGCETPINRYHLAKKWRTCCLHVNREANERRKVKHRRRWKVNNYSLIEHEATGWEVGREGNKIRLHLDGGFEATFPEEYLIEVKTLADEGSGK